MSTPYIIKTSYLINHSIYLDDQLRFASKETDDLIKMSKDFYIQSNMKYPKFHKMDLLSKMAVLCAEHLMTNSGVRREHIGDDKIGVFIANRSSSLHTDRTYVERSFTDQGWVPNPALFVYTLPNIMLGELSIRHQFKGEQSTWISESFDADFITKYVLSLFDEQVIEACIVGWVDFEDNDVGAFLSWISNKEADPADLEELTPMALQNKYERTTSNGEY